MTKFHKLGILAVGLAFMAGVFILISNLAGDVRSLQAPCPEVVTVDSNPRCIDLAENAAAVSQLARQVRRLGGVPVVEPDDLPSQVVIGPAGPTGPTGGEGVDGADGQDGSDGAPGRPGSDGEDGAPGPQGEPGPVGPAGPAGPVGAAGKDGATGPAGPQGPEGPAGPACPDGATPTETTFPLTHPGVTFIICAKSDSEP